MTIPCITMVGTHPTFSQVPVTQELSEAVIGGQYPCQKTLVTKCVVPSLSKQEEGLEVPGFRREALRHFVAFKTLARSFWSALVA